MYGNGYSMAIVLDHRSTATSLTGNQAPAYSVSDKGPHDRLRPEWCLNLIHGFY